MRNGSAVAAFERAFAEYVGAKYAIALCNGTATLHTALVALGVKPGDRVAVPPLTMASTTIAVLHAGAVPVFVDVDRDTWIYRKSPENCVAYMPVDLYGIAGDFGGDMTVVDSAQTLRQANKPSPHAFTSYSFQASKILALGEGGMLVTDSEELATRAREFSSLGYRMRADRPRIDPATIKSPTFARHHTYPAFNYRMSDIVAGEAMRQRNASLRHWDQLRGLRRAAADMYRDAIAGCDWLTPQHVPDGWTHDYWTYAIACDTPERCLQLLDAVEKHGGERPYPAWRLSYTEPFLSSYYENRARPSCPVAESLQPRLLQFQTNNLASAETNARALRKAIEELS